MTTSEALRTLGFTSMPTSEAEVDSQYRQQAQQGAKRLQATPGDKSQIIAELRALQKARDVTLAAMRNTFQSNTNTPTPLPPGVTSSAPFAPPAPGPFTPASSSNPATRNSLPMSFQVRPSPISPQTRGPISRRPRASSLKRIGKRILALATLLFLASIAAFIGRALFCGQAQVEFWTWPAARVFVDGKYLGEAPSPTAFTVRTGFGRRQFAVKPKNGETAFTFRARLWPGCVYRIKADIKKRDYTIEERKKS